MVKSERHKNAGRDVVKVAPPGNPLQRNKGLRENIPLPLPFLLF